MQSELSAISPILLNTMVGLVALLFVVMIINAIMKLVKSYRPIPIPIGNGYGKDSDNFFAKSVRFNLHAQEQANLCHKVEEVDKRVIELDKHLSKLVTIGERQAAALDELVELRREFIKNG